VRQLKQPGRFGRVLAFNKMAVRIQIASETLPCVLLWVGVRLMLFIAPGPVPSMLLVAIAVLALSLGVVAWQVVRTARRIEGAQERADHEGGAASAQESSKYPLMTLSRFGTTSDPLNVKIVGTAEQVVAAFLAAGWYRADRIRVLSSLRLSIATIFKLSYSSAPVSNLYLFGRKQDYAFQKPGSDARERDHIRCWDSGEVAADGRPIWVGAATRDVNVDISPRTRLFTHRIAPDVDSERATVARDLTATGGVIEQQWDAGFGRPISTVNSMGYPFHGDGRIVVLTLADVPVLLPVTAGLSGPTGGRLTGQLVRLFSWLLPRRGRRRAREAARREAADARVRENARERERPPVGV